MSVKRLAQYMDKINKGQPIDLGKFYQLLDRFAFADKRKPGDIDTIRHKGKLHTVTQISNKLNVQIRLLLASSIENTRAGLAKQNRSHAGKVNGSFIVKRQGFHDPILVMIGRDGSWREDISQSPTALLVENKQNFIDFDLTVSFLERWTDYRFETDMDIIFTEGNEISNGLHKQFLSRYQHLFLCLDVDLGGMTIAKNIASLLPDTTFDFLVPDDISSRLEQIVEIRDATYIDEVIQIGQSHPKLAPIAKLIRDHQKTLEQESYLNDEQY